MQVTSSASSYTASSPAGNKTTRTVDRDVQPNQVTFCSAGASFSVVQLSTKAHPLTNKAVYGLLGLLL